ncbi:DUF1592 domain-containing protein [Catalinimonas alkaloidigena]|uniref:DUF1592 domain-containing protein n=1 Tax=Catalinimonas alkaloidigena TaxID=1075417 RepID=UPI002404E127|nr:DUF1592 domain-containing protein [Catalinimonas alkaloidigena]
MILNKTPIHRIFFLSLFIFSNASLAAQPKYDFIEDIRPVLDQHCFSCHNVGKVAGGINLEKYENQGRLLDDGHIWLKVVKQLQSGQMPPDTRPRLTENEYHILVDGINDILISSLTENNPGRVVIRRLSHREYQYTVKDLIGVDFDAEAFFPADGSGGSGFDNYARTLFFTPLKLERYYAAADQIVDAVSKDPKLWTAIVAQPYDPSIWQKAIRWIKSFFVELDPLHHPSLAAKEVLFPFATKTYRRFVKPQEKNDLIRLFQQVYAGSDSLNTPERFDTAIQECLKAMMISPQFLYKVEDEQPVDIPYPLSNFELASRLSYFLWSSMPDQELFEVAYRENLHDTQVLNEQVERMLKDPKAARFAESFISQWMGITKLKSSSPVDPEKFPEFDENLRQAMYQETVEYFTHIITDGHNLLELIDSDYTFLNETLADHYGIADVEGEEFRKVQLANRSRGGVMGMGSVLASTSLPLRTSPVLRGKWVLEEILGTPPPPPPPDVGELPEESSHEGTSLRNLLEIHRDNDACRSCHQKMDPIGFGLEHYDAIGRWRDTYGSTEPIIAWDTLASGEPFNGPIELKKILFQKQDNFARTISERMFTYAIGRSIEFVDEPTMQNLSKILIENNFNSTALIKELVNSYPFRYRTNDYGRKLDVL